MSNNSIGADNQQGRLDPKWLVGFVDGEGCFSVSFVKNKTTRFGYQIFTEFVITQGEKSLDVLEDIQQYLGCGKVYRNARHDNHREDLYRYCVRSIKDLEAKIVPFFNEYPLLTAKRYDFESFAAVVEMMKNGDHLKLSGFETIRQIAATMNRKKIRILEPSETKRQTPDEDLDEDIVRSRQRCRANT